MPRKRERGKTSMLGNGGRRDKRKGLRQVSAGETRDERQVSVGERREEKGTVPGLEQVQPLSPAFYLLCCCI